MEKKMETGMETGILHRGLFELIFPTHMSYSQHFPHNAWTWVLIREKLGTILKLPRKPCIHTVAHMGFGGIQNLGVGL